MRADLSQSQLGAPYFGRAFVSAVELGKVRPSVTSLDHFATKLGVSVAALAGDHVPDADLVHALTQAVQLLAAARRRDGIERQAHGVATFAIEGALRTVVRHRRAG